MEPHVSTLTADCKLANQVSALNHVMPTLTERLQEVMHAMGWEHGDVVRVSGASSSAVSQWLGKGSKIIYSIGQQEAAEALSKASGYAALWIAKGTGPKFSERPQAQGQQQPSVALALPVVLRAIAGAPAPVRNELAQVLALFAQSGADTYGLRIKELLTIDQRHLRISRVEGSTPRVEVNPRELENVIGSLIELAGTPSDEARAKGRRIARDLTAPKSTASVNVDEKADHGSAM